MGRPLNLVLYVPFRMFAYSSNNFEANFDLMVSMPLFSYGSATGHREREREGREREGREREGPRGKFERDREGSLRGTVTRHAPDAHDRKGERDSLSRVSRRL